jgi:putative membrane protein
MVDFLLKLAVNTAALLVAVRVVPQLELSFGRDGQDWWRALAVAGLFGVVNSYLRPILKVLSLPLTLVTLGLMGLVVNVALFLLVGFVSGQLRLGLSIAAWPAGPFDADVAITALLASIVMSLVATVLSVLLSTRRIIGM